MKYIVVKPSVLPKTAEISVSVKSVFPSPDKEAQKTTMTSLGEGGKTFSIYAKKKTTR